MVRRTAWLAGVVIARIAAADRPETNATLVGTAAFSAQPQAERGTVRVTVRGLGTIGNACADAGARQFVATYDGELAIAPDHTFTAPLYPASPVITTPSGCAITELELDHVTGVSIEARLGELVARGRLAFQNLDGVDLTELNAGSFDELHAYLAFAPEAPCPCGT